MMAHWISVNARAWGWWRGWRGLLLATVPGQGMAARQQSTTAEFEAFFQQYQRMIFGYLFRMTGQEQLANDLTQETFVRAWQRFERIRGYQQPRSWLLRVATNLALSQLQRQRVAANVTVPLDDATSPASSDPTVRLAESDLVRHALMAMPPRQRAALVLREIHDLPYDEVAQMLGISPAAARMLLFRAREQFRANYLQLGGQQP